MAASIGTFPTAIDHHLVRTVPAAITTYKPLAEGSAGTYQTLDAMRDAVLGRISPDYSGFEDPYNIRAANQICAQASGQNARAQIAVLFDYVSHRIKYESHPLNQQRVQDCRRTLEANTGDCVSKSVCLSTLLACLNISSRFVAQCPDGEEFSHVYVEALLDDGSWLALDPVAEDQPMGWRQTTLDGGFETAWEIF